MYGSLLILTYVKSITVGMTNSWVVSGDKFKLCLCYNEKKNVQRLEATGKLQNGLSNKDDVSIP